MPEHRHSQVPRAVRVAEEIQRILGEIFLTKVQISTTGLLTITQVEMSRDLRHATVYLSFLGPATDNEGGIREVIRKRKQLRYHLGAELRTKYVPQLRFFLDKSVERSARINAILEDLHADQTVPST